MKSIKYFAIAFLLSGAMSMQAMDPQEKLQAKAMLALKILHQEEIKMFHTARANPDKSTDGKAIVFPADTTGIPDIVRYRGVDFKYIWSELEKYDLDETALKERRAAIRGDKQ